MNTILRLLTSVSQIGTNNIVGPGRNRIIINNITTLVTAFLAFTISTMLYFITGSVAIIIGAYIEVVGFILVIVLNYKGKYTADSLLAFIVQLGSLIYFSFLFGNLADNKLMAIFLLSLPLLIFESNQLKVLMISITFIVVILLQINNEYNFIPAFINIPAPKAGIVKIVSITCIMLLTIMVIAIYQYYTNSLVGELNKQSAKLQHQTEIAHKASADKTLYAQVVSHEVAAPVSSIIIILRELKSTISLLSAGTKSQLPIIQTLKDRIQDMESWLAIGMNNIHSVRDLSVLEAGIGLPLEKEHIDLEVFLFDLMKICRNPAKNQNVALKLNIKVDNLRFIYEDKTKLTQILLNLILNALKFSNQHKTININVTSTCDAVLEIAVIDEGPGMTTVQTQQIFNAYYTESKNTITGIGLGLFIVYNSVKALKGSVEVISAIGKGSTFLIRLPLVIGNVPARLTSIYPPESIQLKEIKVLVVDDDPMTRLVLGRWLNNEFGMEIIHAASAEDAYTLALSKRPELIITDQLLAAEGQQTGLELLSKLRASTELPHLKAILCTGLSLSSINLDKLLELNVKFMRRPFNPSVLTTIISEYFGYTATVVQ
jgi:signal transduction histidine kinase/CheY-like chemotaxis protein